MTNANTRSLCIIGWLLLVISIAYLHFHAALLTTMRNSDGAVALLMANDIISGNFLLKYWTLAPAHYYTLDTLFFALCIKMLGFKPHLMYTLPALFYGLLAGTISMMVYYLNKQNHKFFSLLICLFLVAIPAIDALILTYHLLTYLYILIVFWIFSFTKNLWAYCFSFVLLLMCNIGDPTSYLIGNIPLVLLVFLNVTSKNKKIYGIFLSLGCICISSIIKWVISHHGFIVATNALNVNFVMFENFGHNIACTLDSLLVVGNANFFGQPLLSLSTILKICHLFILLAGCVLIFRFFNKISTINADNSARNCFLSLLAISIIVNILSPMFSAQYTGLSDSRYLLPVFFYLSLFTAAEIPYLTKKHMIGIILLIFLLPLSVIDFYQQIKQHPREDYAQRLPIERYLLAHHLTHGFAGYWDSHIFTVETYQAIKIRPVFVSDAEKNLLTPFHFLSKSTWYDTQHKANFVIIENAAGPNPNWGNVTLSTATKTFGKPAQIVNFQAYKILIWNKNITPELAPQKI